MFFRNILFLLMRFLMFASSLSAIFCLIKAFSDSSNLRKWIIFCIISVIMLAVFYILNIFRKNRFPVPGRDYL